MNLDSVILGLFLGIIIMLPYAVLFFRAHKEMPPLGKVLYIVIAAAALTSAVEVLFIVSASQYIWNSRKPPCNNRIWSGGRDMDIN